MASGPALPDSLVLEIFLHLPHDAVLIAGLTCHQWLAVSRDEFLWRELFYSYYRIPRSVPRHPAAVSWYREFKRLFDCIPCVEVQTLREHHDQVLHLAFSHRGHRFSSCSKDCTVKLWDTERPDGSIALVHSSSMRQYNWGYTQFSQFNADDSLLLVSGVYLGPHQSSSGEIAVISLENYTLLSRVRNKPYDVFGCWLNEAHLISGNLHWIGNMTSCSVLWLNKAFQDVESENVNVVKRLFKIQNMNASTIRTVMVAHCRRHDSPDLLLDYEAQSRARAERERGGQRHQPLLFDLGDSEHEEEEEDGDEQEDGEEEEAGEAGRAYPRPTHAAHSLRLGHMIQVDGVLRPAQYDREREGTRIPGGRVHGKDPNLSARLLPAHPLPLGRDGGEDLPALHHRQPYLLSSPDRDQADPTRSDDHLRAGPGGGAKLGRVLRLAGPRDRHSRPHHRHGPVPRPQVPVREQPGVAGGVRDLGPHVAPAHRRGDRPARHRPEEPAGGEAEPAGAPGLHAQRRVLLHLPGRQPRLRGQWRGGQARVHLGPPLQHLPGAAAARRRGELGGLQPRRPGAAAVRQRRLHHQGVAVPPHGAAGPGPPAPRPHPQAPLLAAGEEERRRRRRRRRRRLHRQPQRQAVRPFWGAGTLPPTARQPSSLCSNTPGTHGQLSLYLLCPLPPPFFFLNPLFSKTHQPPGSLQSNVLATRRRHSDTSPAPGAPSPIPLSGSR